VARGCLVDQNPPIGAHAADDDRDNARGKVTSAARYQSTATPRTHIRVDAAERHLIWNYGVNNYLLGNRRRLRHPIRNADTPTASRWLATTGFSISRTRFVTPESYIEGNTIEWKKTGV